MTKQLHWRDVLPVHPAAELFPMMSEAELRELGKDIKENRLRVPVVLWEGNGKTYLLDGRNRLDALEMNGRRNLIYVDDLGHYRSNIPGTKFSKCSDPYALAIALNIQRRHLTSDQKRELIANVLKADPSKSDRQIAAATKSDHKTVGKVRKEKEGRGDVPHVETRTDTKGRKQPAKRKPAEQPVFASPQEAHATPDDAQVEADKAEVRRLYANVQEAEAEAGVSESFLDNATKWLKCIGRHAESHAGLMLDSDWSALTLADCKVMFKLLDEAQEPIHRIRRQGAAL